MRINGPPAGPLASAAVLLLVAAFIHGWIAAYGLPVMGFSDAMDYLLLADFYRSRLDGGVDQIAHHMYAQSRFPPLFPLILALAGGGSASALATALVTSGSAVLACLAVWWWVWRESGSAAAALMVGLALVLYPAYFLLSLYPVSEPLSLLLLALVFALQARVTTPRQWMLMAAVVGLAPLARSALLPLIPAFAVVLLMQRERRLGRTLLAMTIAILPSLLWQLHRASLGAESYTESLNPAAVISALGGWPTLIWLPALRLLHALLDNLSAAGAVPTALMLVAVPPLLIGWWDALRRGAMHALFLPLYLAMVLIWPYPTELGRLLVIVYPLGVFYVIAGLQRLPGLVHLSEGPRRAGAMVITGLVVMVLSGPGVLSLAGRAALPIEPGLERYKRETLFFAADSDENAVRFAHQYAQIDALLVTLADAVPKGECVYATPPQLLLQKVRVPAFPYPAGLADPVQGRRELLHCRYFLLTAIASRQADFAPFYPWAALEGWTVPVASRSVVLNDREGLAAELLKRVDE